MAEEVCSERRQLPHINNDSLLKVSFSLLLIININKNYDSLKSC
jgi:hypothetical protein